MSLEKFTKDVVELAALAWFENLGYDLIYGPDIAPGGDNQLRAYYSNIILDEKLRAALISINPQIPYDVIDDVCRKVSRSASPDLFEDNRIFHRMLVNGVYVEYSNPDGSIIGDNVWLVDFNDVSKNSFSAVNQFTVVENQQNRRADIVIFVNGIPLAVVELKNAVVENTTNHHAYNQLQIYKREIPSLFRTNAVLVISDGIEARVGSLTASNERFMPWRTVDGVTIAQKGSAELETLLKGLFEKCVLLDLVKNFTVFEADGKQIVKKIAAYHQYHAVKKAVECTVEASSEDGDKRAGVIWHSHGSGKSLTMAFYSGKITLKNEMKNPTLVVLTDRNDLDDQLYGTFCLYEELLRQIPVKAKDRMHARDLLSVPSGGVIFITIQKFVPEKGEALPLLSDRRNIVVIADEAHKSQYDFIDGFTRHIRDGLPNASFIGFTGTPIDLSDRDALAVFGETIHAYDIQQAVEDGATVPIYYESRLAKIELDEAERPHIEDDFQEVIEGEEIDRKKTHKRKWDRLEALVGAEKRVDLVAIDIVDHFECRIEAMDGKGMVVCMSHRICVDLYNAIIKLRPDWHDDDDKKGVVKMVMTGSESDLDSFQQHLRSKAGRDLLFRRAKDPSDSLKLVIVRNMWLTGFDAPSMHTMYVDKPMQGHGLMQAIARVNRVFNDKSGGLIVDYFGIADSLKKALAHYSMRDRDKTGVPQGEAIAIMLENYELVKQLFHDFDYSAAIDGNQQDWLRIFPAAMERILSKDKGRDRFMQLSLDLSKAFALSAASNEAKEIRNEVGFFQNIRSALLKITSGSDKDIEYLNTSLQQIVSRAVSSTEVVDIFAAAGLQNSDISVLSDEFLAEVKVMEKKNLALEMLKKLLKDKINLRFKKNVVQARNFTEILESNTHKYQDRAIETAQVIEELISLAQEMRQVNDKGESLGLNDDEYAFYDALTDNMDAQNVLGDVQLSKISRELADSIKRSTNFNWTVKESVRAKIRVVVKRILRKHGYPSDLQVKAIQTVLDQAELLSAEWSE